MKTLSKTFYLLEYSILLNLRNMTNHIQHFVYFVAEKVYYKLTMLTIIK